jgi:hypothetical protein
VPVELEEALLTEVDDCAMRPEEAFGRSLAGSQMFQTLQRFLINDSTRRFITLWGTGWSMFLVSWFFARQTFLVFLPVPAAPGEGFGP